ncbi:MAG: hypothetical protein LBH50_03500 [Spirochaetaceae bacterium]|nr:hypothetical protein [Spirochaetaceae bacterium]
MRGIRNMPRPLFFVNLLVLAAVCFAEPLYDLAGGTVADSLLRGDLLSEARFGDASPVLAPNSAALRSILERSAAALSPNMIVESLYLHKKPASFGAGDWTRAEKTSVLNTLVSLSTLAGTRYYSNSRRQMRVFYETSGVINDPREKTPLPDPAFSPDGNLPSALTLYARQKDLSFGDNVYRYDYFITDGSIIFTQKNYTALSYGIIPLAGKEKLCSAVAVIDAEKYFLIYIASMAKAPAIPGVKKKAGDSFKSRAEALIKWFTERTDSLS